MADSSTGDTPTPTPNETKIKPNFGDTPLQDRIEQFLADCGVQVYRCCCGIEIGIPAKDVAEGLVDSLGLTQQWTWSWDEQLTGTELPGYGYPVDSREEAEAEGDSYMTIVSRWVTGWEPQP